MGQNLATLKHHLQTTPVISRHGLKSLPVIIGLTTICLATASGLAYFLANRLDNLQIRSGQRENPLVSKPPEIEAPIVTPAPVDPIAEESARLQKVIEDFQATQPTPFYITVKNLKTGAAATLRPDVSVPSGSIYKLFLANQVYKLNEAGQLNMNSIVAGTGYTFQQCTMQMVQNSMNFCGEHVRSHLGAAPQTAALQAQGYTCTNLMLQDAAHTCTKDLQLLYERLYFGGYFTPEHTAQFMEYLRKQMWRFRIPTGIPVNLLASGKAITYNKTGDVFAYANDSGIVKGENTDFSLMVLSGSWKKVFPDSSYAIRHLTGLVYNFMNGTNHALPY